jgi:outer membrane autotransporter protein
VQLSLTSGYEISTAVVVSAMVQGMREAAIESEGERVDNSARTDVSVGFGLSVKATDHVTFTGGASTGIFADRFGDNQQGRVVGNIGVRYGFF